mmetsp:Transcript_11447/g.22081  ORF Transcript_11447/g.22081 Transcript_11447/m.22081 type:complete len:314 (-) Transcript_11447:109-1050(-)|eukprot:CAMPEP_0172737412 /NCGR_PEP_ID=MMETSP1074-20121228/117598_1 /TAXON_ID=2916 /ORGANISM="Ceratium fusus, Strain PA161109" /LENGTH=313 /DNA_ID=CAMNT_0013566801 /DNA_START=59 /DNA_END=1000 /DNA_ORIENTATION=-
MANSTFGATVSLMHNNLACSPNGWVACLHNSVNLGGGKLMLHALTSGLTTNGPEINQATSLRYLELASGVVLCLTSTSGTQLYTEDASALLFHAGVHDVSTSDTMKCHQASCVVPSFQQIVVGTSKGALLLINAAGGQYATLPEATPSTVAGEVADVCFSEVAQTVFSVHTNGELRPWTPSPEGGYTCMGSIPTMGQAPVRILPLGARLAVAFGPGTLCLYDALSRELQVEVTAHGRWINGMVSREDLGQVATVSEDTVLNVWQVEPSSGHVSLVTSTIPVDKLLTGVGYFGDTICVSAYDSDELYRTSLMPM